MPNLIGQTIGAYKIVALLGKGGMAEVYRAKQVLGGGIGRDVALKLIDARLATSPEFIARFRREAQTLVSLSHPHILKAFDFGEYQDSVYLVMELLSGGSLAELINRGPLPFAQIVSLLDQIGSALDYAHEQGVIHRDLKPHNVLLDSKGNAFLTDFGIAKLAHQTTALTHSGSAIGTPNYMAPEQWANNTIDARADIYSLGVMIYEMVSGRVPFQGDTPFRLMHMHTHEPPPLVTSVRPDTPPALNRVIQMAMAKNPAERHPSAGALVADAKAALAGSMTGRVTSARSEDTTVVVPSAVSPTAPGAATPSPSPATQQRSKGSKRGIVGAVAAVVILAVVGIGVMLSGSRSTNTSTAAPTDNSTGIATTATLLPAQEVNITSEGTVQASTVFAGFPAALSVDGDLTTSWFSVGPGPNGNPSTYRWTAKQDDRIESITIISNRLHSNPDYQKNFGYEQVTIQVLDSEQNVVYETTEQLAGTPDPDVIVKPQVVGRSILLILAGHEATVCSGFGELKVVALR